MTQNLSLKVLDKQIIRQIISDAEIVLNKIGIEIESEEVRALLSGNNVKITEKVQGRKYPVAFIPSDLVDHSLHTTPPVIHMYDRDGNHALTLGGDATHFTPGSCATNYYDVEKGEHRKPTEQDLAGFTRVADALPNIHMVSTAMIVSEAHPETQDAYRLRVVLENSTKPIVTGTFGDNFELMKDMLLAVRGSGAELKEKPLAIFDCCPSPALKWAKVWSEDIIRCGRFGIPVEFVSMPQPGLSGPITLYDNLVQHTAETISGIVISQLANKGAPVIYGGSPTMVSQQGVALLGNIGVAKMGAAYAQVAKYMGIPCHAYLGLSDAKTPDVQAGYEKGMSTLIAVLAGINNVSGPGMLESENCQCAEMLVIDNDIIGTALYFARGIQRRETNAAEEIGLMATEGVGTETSVRYLCEEVHIPVLADTQNLANWQATGKRGMLDNAATAVQEILRDHRVAPLDGPVKEALDSYVRLNEKHI